MKRTLEDGVFFDTCHDATEHWDDEWVVCPVCSGTIDFIVDDEGESYIEVHHQDINCTKH